MESTSDRRTSDSETAVRQGIERNTIIRILSTAIGLPIIFVGLYSGGVLFTLLILMVMAVAAVELTTIIHEHKIGVVTFTALVYVLAVSLSFAYSSTVVWLGIVTAGGLIILVAELWKPLFGQQDVRRSLMLVGLLVGLGHVGGFAIILRERPDGLFWWLLILIATFATDTLAFAGGRTYGKTPLLPDWSPKKTVEGTLTGIVGAILIGMAALFVYRLMFPSLMLIAAGAPIFAVLGDLLESKFKRVYHAKDSSVKGLNPVPGHGGILDRIDSLSFVVIFVYLILLLS